MNPWPKAKPRNQGNPELVASRSVCNRPNYEAQRGERRDFAPELWAETAKNRGLAPNQTEIADRRNR